MLTYAMEDRGGLPLYEYLYRCIRRDILSGALAAGERLPSKRALAEHLRLSVITVEGAYSQLEAQCNKQSGHHQQLRLLMDGSALFLHRLFHFCPLLPDVSRYCHHKACVI